MWPKKRRGVALDGAVPAPGVEPLAGLLHRLDWAIMRPLAHKLGGDERSLIRGAGMELTEVREYQPGDDVRHIDWNITARAGTTYLRESYTERALDVWMLIDLSASIDWGTAQATKRDRALEFAAAAGQLLHRRGNRVGTILFADRLLETIAPGVGRTHLLRLLRAIQARSRQSTRAVTDLAGTISYAERIFRSRSLVLVVSDFMATDDWQAALGKLARRHEVVAVHLHDPREGVLPDVGLVTLEDPETGQQMVIDTRNRKLRDRYNQAAQAQAEKLRTDLAGCGVEQLVISTAEPLLPALVNFLHRRKKKFR